LAAWWKNYELLLPTLSDDDKDRIEDLTGGIPLLLRGLLNPKHHGKTYDEIEEEFLASVDIQNVHARVTEFARHQRKTQGTFFFDL
jgi:hypothetical protein